MDNNNSKEFMEEQVINEAFQELLNDYLATKHRKRVEIITKAFNFANQAHKGIKRRSGEPYILHPIAVAKIVCNEIGLGSTSICAALLHDVVEDTDYTVEDIENIFGKKVAQIVDGLTKISGGIFGDRASAQAENFKKLLLTMSNDIRVILIKIADRLHNMRTLGSMLPSKQFKIAGETLYIYAPLAHRLGLYQIKTELENLSFKYEHPEEYAKIEEQLKETATQRDELFKRFTAPIKEALDNKGINYHIQARVKSIYSIWNKMQTKNVTFDEIYDILAVRIIFEPKEQKEELSDCFDIYVTISKIFKPHPDRLRDWVSHPKSNGYQALHVTLMGPDGQWIEVQIRSERMNDVAEQGFAAHWKYKDGGGSEDEGELDKWLKTIKEVLDDPQPDTIDFLDTIKLNLYASEIFVFTPKGELKTMPQNATALDFAFLLHTDIGTHCIGAKVNHKLVPLSHKLQSGDQVEVLTSKSQRVQASWEQFATTAKAKSKISSILRKERKTLQKEGETILHEWLRSQGIIYDSNVILKLCKIHGKSSEEELLEALGGETLKLTDNDANELHNKQSSNWRKYLSFTFGLTGKSKQPSNETCDLKVATEEEAKNAINPKNILKLTGEAIQKKYIMADCCQPIPGDDVLGFLDEQNHIVIHKRQCPIAAKLKAGFGNRIIATVWDTHKELSFLVYIQFRGIDSMGVLNDVTSVLSKQLNMNIHKICMEANDGIFEGKLQLWVHDVNDVRQICENLRKLPNIKSVSRVEK